MGRKRGGPIYRFGDITNGAYRVVQGAIFLSIDKHGKTPAGCGLVLPSQTFGEEGVIGPTPRRRHDALCLSGKGFETLIEQVALTEETRQEVARHALDRFLFIEQMRAKSSEEGVEEMMIRYRELSLSHMVIAAMLNISREYVTQILNRPPQAARKRRA